ncbi:sialate O-acetylesterase [Adhaeribacter swui]|uniref:Sialate O-acetylesterase n=1 Tax=Adhaeribacter swui TaxID=2086471 RepID=A0A7G7GEB0_9BACT|nr:sialate O-acetylesterase [Adhaeribacter swui]QNF35494.1 sialate O-acetylesterase [Adhaeribacter swui]
MKYLFLLLLLIGLHSTEFQDDPTRTQNFPKAEVRVKDLPKKEKVWVFILAGQSNMAGRGQVEPQDTIPNSRIFTINKQNQLILAKEPLHFYEPNLTGLDCGLSFGRTLLPQIPPDVSILLVPTAVGGSSISQWLGDSTHRQVPLLTNFKEKVALAQKLGKIQGILWHQGESDANPKDIPLYQSRLTSLFAQLRTITKNKNLPIVAGELGLFSQNPESWLKINQQLRNYAKIDKNYRIVSTADLSHKGDSIHFNSTGQRILGQRFAQEYLKFKKINSAN